MRNPLKGFLMVALIVSLVFSLIPVLTQNEPARAEEQTWTAMNNGLSGLYGGIVSSIVIDPKNTQTIYAGTEDGGIFKSTNGGASWTAINNGISKIWVDCLAIDPVNTQTIYAGTGGGGGGGGFFKSTDGGMTWTLLSLKDYWIYDLVIDPSNTQVIYAAAGQGVSKSTNGGLTWTQMYNGLTNTYVGSIAIDPTNTQIIYAGTFGGGVFKSTNGGLNWFSIGNGLGGRGVRCFLIDPTNTQIIYAGTLHFGIFKSTDGGANWSAKNDEYGLASFSVLSLAIDPTNTQIIYAGTVEGGVYKSIDGGETWTQINNGLTYTYVNSLAIDPANTKTIYAGTDRGGVFKTISVYSITALSGTGGTINPSGTFKVTSGGTKKFTITANTGYKIKQILVDDNPITITNSSSMEYTFTDVKSDHTIKAYFESVSKAITASAGTGGSISPSGTTTVNYGDSKTFIISLNQGYKIKDVLVDGVSVGVVSSYTFTNVTGDHTIQASFEQLTFTITSSAGTGGSISPSGTVTANYGDSKTFTISPSSGYKTSDVKVDGKSIGPVSSYTFTNITGDHTIEAVFEKSEIVIVLKIGDSNFTVNGEPHYPPLDSPPIIKNNRTLLPIRAIIESLGGTVSWDATEKKVTITLGSKTIELWIGKFTAMVNGVNKPIDPSNNKVVPEIINSRTMLPLRFVAENIGATVDWDGTTKTITITYQQ